MSVWGHLFWAIPLVPFVWHLFAHIIPMIREENADEKRFVKLFDDVVRRNRR